ncbi:uncharacterized protein LOC5520168 isoform X2 [Nematostella vectensis]|uniref:uncharacterized protein LOC5520168 isoform X2 n=1 Tax=Nematostella vectensis TaxID=45351 RepID=UPI0020771A52|nr:uncharacterized protein LOC5520168 isoform X2 [Nematostella vectensis]
MALSIRCKVITNSSNEVIEFNPSLPRRSDSKSKHGKLAPCQDSSAREKNLEITRENSHTNSTSDLHSDNLSTIVIEAIESDKPNHHTSVDNCLKLLPKITSNSEKTCRDSNQGVIERHTCGARGNLKCRNCGFGDEMSQEGNSTVSSVATGSDEERSSESQWQIPKIVIQLPDGEVTDRPIKLPPKKPPRKNPKNKGNKSPSTPSKPAMSARRDSEENIEKALEAGLDQFGVEVLQEKEGESTLRSKKPLGDHDDLCDLLSELEGLDNTRKSLTSSSDDEKTSSYTTGEESGPESIENISFGSETCSTNEGLFSGFKITDKFGVLDASVVNTVGELARQEGNSVKTEKSKVFEPSNAHGSVSGVTSKLDESSHRVQYLIQTKEEKGHSIELQMDELVKELEGFDEGNADGKGEIKQLKKSGAGLKNIAVCDSEVERQQSCMVSQKINKETVLESVENFDAISEDYLTAEKRVAISIRTENEDKITVHPEKNIAKSEGLEHGIRVGFEVQNAEDCGQMAVALNALVSGGHREVDRQDKAIVDSVEKIFKHEEERSVFNAKTMRDSPEGDSNVNIAKHGTECDAESSSQVGCDEILMTPNTHRDVIKMRSSDKAEGGLTQRETPRQLEMPRKQQIQLNSSAENHGIEKTIIWGQGGTIFAKYNMAGSVSHEPAAHDSVMPCKIGVKPMGEREMSDVNRLRDVSDVSGTGPLTLMTAGANAGEESNENSDASMLGMECSSSVVKSRAANQAIEDEDIAVFKNTQNKSISQAIGGEHMAEFANNGDDFQTENSVVETSSVHTMNNKDANTRPDVDHVAMEMGAVEVSDDCDAPLGEERKDENATKSEDKVKLRLGEHFNRAVAMEMENFVTDDSSMAVLECGNKERNEVNAANGDVEEDAEVKHAVAMEMENVKVRGDGGAFLERENEARDYENTVDWDSKDVESREDEAVGVNVTHTVAMETDNKEVRDNFGASLDDESKNENAINIDSEHVETRVEGKVVGERVCGSTVEEKVKPHDPDRVIIGSENEDGRDGNENVEARKQFAESGQNASLENAEDTNFETSIYSSDQNINNSSVIEQRDVNIDYQLTNSAKDREGNSGVEEISKIENEESLVDDFQVKIENVLETQIESVTFMGGSDVTLSAMRNNVGSVSQEGTTWSLEAGLRDMPVSSNRDIHDVSQEPIPPDGSGERDTEVCQSASHDGLEMRDDKARDTGVRDLRGMNGVIVTHEDNEVSSSQNDVDYVTVSQKYGNGVTGAEKDGCDVNGTSKNGEDATETHKDDRDVTMTQRNADDVNASNDVIVTQNCDDVTLSHYDELDEQGDDDVTNNDVTEDSAERVGDETTISYNDDDVTEASNRMFEDDSSVAYNDDGVTVTNDNGYDDVIAKGAVVDDSTVAYDGDDVTVTNGNGCDDVNAKDAVEDDSNVAYDDVTGGDDVTVNIYFQEGMMEISEDGESVSVSDRVDGADNQKEWVPCVAEFAGAFVENLLNRSKAKLKEMLEKQDSSSEGCDIANGDGESVSISDRADVAEKPEQCVVEFARAFVENLLNCSKTELKEMLENQKSSSEGCGIENGEEVHMLENKETPQGYESFAEPENEDGKELYIQEGQKGTELYVDGETSSTREGVQTLANEQETNKRDDDVLYRQCEQVEDTNSVEFYEDDVPSSSENIHTLYDKQEREKDDEYTECEQESEDKTELSLEKCEQEAGDIENAASEVLTGSKVDINKERVIPDEIEQKQIDKETESCLVMDDVASLPQGDSVERKGGDGMRESSIGLVTAEIESVEEESNNHESCDRKENDTDQESIRNLIVITETKDVNLPPNSEEVSAQFMYDKAIIGEETNVEIVSKPIAVDTSEGTSGDNLHGNALTPETSLTSPENNVQELVVSLDREDFHELAGTDSSSSVNNGDVRDLRCAEESLNGMATSEDNQQSRLSHYTHHQSILDETLTENRRSSLQELSDLTVQETATTPGTSRLTPEFHLEPCFQELPNYHDHVITGDMSSKNVASVQDLQPTASVDVNDANVEKFWTDNQECRQVTSDSNQDKESTPVSVAHKDGHEISVTDSTNQAFLLNDQESVSKQDTKNLDTSGESPLVVEQTSSDKETDGDQEDTASGINEESEVLGEIAKMIDFQESETLSPDRDEEKSGLSQQTSEKGESSGDQDNDVGVDEKKLLKLSHDFEQIQSDETAVETRKSSFQELNDLVVQEPTTLQDANRLTPEFHLEPRFQELPNYHVSVIMDDFRNSEEDFMPVCPEIEEHESGLNSGARGCGLKEHNDQMPLHGEKKVHESEQDEPANDQISLDNKRYLLDVDQGPANQQVHHEGEREVPGVDRDEATNDQIILDGEEDLLDIDQEKCVEDQIPLDDAKYLQDVEQKSLTFYAGAVNLDQEKSVTDQAPLDDEINVDSQEKYAGQNIGNIVQVLPSNGQAHGAGAQMLCKSHTEIKLKSPNLELDHFKSLESDGTVEGENQSTDQPPRFSKEGVADVHGVVDEDDQKKLRESMNTNKHDNSYEIELKSKEVEANAGELNEGETIAENESCFPNPGQHDQTTDKTPRAPTAAENETCDEETNAVSAKKQSDPEIYEIRYVELPSTRQSKLEVSSQDNSVDNEDFSDEEALMAIDSTTEAIISAYEGDAQKAVQNIQVDSNTVEGNSCGTDQDIEVFLSGEEAKPGRVKEVVLRFSASQSISGGHIKEYETEEQMVERLLAQSSEIQKGFGEKPFENKKPLVKSTKTIKLSDSQEKPASSEKDSQIRSFEMLVYLETIAKELETFRLEQSKLKESFRVCIAEVIRSLGSLSEAIEFFEVRTISSLHECRMKLGKRIDQLDEQVSSKVATKTLMKSYDFTQSQFAALKQRVKDLEQLCMSLKLKELKEEISREVLAEVSGLMTRLDITSGEVGNLRQQVRDLEKECGAIRGRLAGYTARQREEADPGPVFLESGKESNTSNTTDPLYIRQTSLRELTDSREDLLDSARQEEYRERPPICTTHESGPPSMLYHSTLTTGTYLKDHGIPVPTSLRSSTESRNKSAFTQYDERCKAVKQAGEEGFVPIDLSPKSGRNVWDYDAPEIALADAPQDPRKMEIINESDKRKLTLAERELERQPEERAITPIQQSALSDIEETLNFLAEQSGLIEKQILEASGRSGSRSRSSSSGMGSSSDMDDFDFMDPVDFPLPPPPECMTEGQEKGLMMQLAQNNSQPPPPGYAVLASVEQRLKHVTQDKDESTSQTTCAEQQSTPSSTSMTSLHTDPNATREERVTSTKALAPVASQRVQTHSVQKQEPSRGSLSQGTREEGGLSTRSPTSTVSLHVDQQQFAAKVPSPPPLTVAGSKPISIPSRDGHARAPTSLPGSPQLSHLSGRFSSDDVSPTPPYSPSQKQGFSFPLRAPWRHHKKSEKLFALSGLRSSSSPAFSRLKAEEEEAKDEDLTRKGREKMVRAATTTVEVEASTGARPSQNVSLDAGRQSQELKQSVTIETSVTAPPTTPRAHSTRRVNLILTDPTLRGIPQNKILPGELFNKHCVDGGMKELTKHVQRMSAKPEYDCIVIHCGMNDVSRVSSEEFQYIQLKLVSTIRGKWPRALIVMSGMIPHHTDRTKNAKITRLNQSTRNYCFRNENFAYLDNTIALLDEDGSVDATLYLDEQNVNSTSGMDRLMANLRSKLQSLAEEVDGAPDKSWTKMSETGSLQKEDKLDFSRLVGSDQWSDRAKGIQEVAPDGPDSRTRDDHPDDVKAGPGIQARSPSGGNPTGISMHEYNELYDWLDSCKLAIYIEHFVRAGFDMTSIAGLTPQDLTSINIHKTGHRKKLLSEAAKRKIPLDTFPQRKPADISTWLRLIGMEQYIPEFMDGGFDDMDFVQDMAIEDLDAIGITRTGHQRKIWMAVNALRDTDGSNNNGTPLSIGKTSHRTGASKISPQMTQQVEAEEIYDVPPLALRASVNEPTVYRETDLDQITGAKSMTSSDTLATVTSSGSSVKVTPNVVHVGKDHETDLDNLLSHLEEEGVAIHPSHQGVVEKGSASPRDQISLAEDGIPDENLLEVSVPSPGSSTKAVSDVRCPPDGSPSSHEATAYQSEVKPNLYVVSESKKSDTDTRHFTSPATSRKERLIGSSDIVISDSQDIDHSPVITSPHAQNQPAKELEQKVLGLSLDSSPPTKRPPPPVKPKSIKKTSPKVAPKPGGSPHAPRAKASSFSGQMGPVIAREGRLSPKPDAVVAREGRVQAEPNRSKASSFSGQTEIEESQRVGTTPCATGEPTTRRFSTGSNAKHKKVPPPTPPKKWSGSWKSRDSDSDSSIDAVLDEMEKRRAGYEDRRKSFENLQRKFSEPSCTSPRNVMNGQRDSKSDDGEALDEQIKSVFRRPSMEDLLGAEDFPPPPTEEHETTDSQQDSITDEELQKELDCTENLFKDINSMLSDFSTELDFMFDTEPTPTSS